MIDNSGLMNDLKMKLLAWIFGMLQLEEEEAGSNSRICNRNQEGQSDLLSVRRSGDS